MKDYIAYIVQYLECSTWLGSRAQFHILFTATTCQKVSDFQGHEMWVRSLTEQGNDRTKRLSSVRNLPFSYLGRSAGCHVTSVRFPLIIALQHTSVAGSFYCGQVFDRFCVPDLSVMNSEEYIILPAFSLVKCSVMWPHLFWNLNLK